MKREKVMAAKVRGLRKCGTVRATPARLRPHCIAIRKDLDPGRYATDKELDVALANGTYKVGCGCKTADEVHAMLEDCLV